jgi:hypothetical protein
MPGSPAPDLDHVGPEARQHHRRERPANAPKSSTRMSPNAACAGASGPDAPAGRRRREAASTSLVCARRGPRPTTRPGVSTNRTVIRAAWWGRPPDRRLRRPSRSQLLVMQHLAHGHDGLHAEAVGVHLVDELVARLTSEGRGDRGRVGIGRTPRISWRLRPVLRPWARWIHPSPPRRRCAGAHRADTTSP